MTEVHFTRSGPLPTVAEFSGYENVLPGAADRILSMAERAQAAAIEDRHTSTKVESRTFLLSAFGVAYFPWLLALVTVALIIAGRDGVAAVTGIVTAATVGPQILAQVRPNKKSEEPKK